MIRKLVIALALAGLASVAAAATVYKWMDAEGQVHYTDRPPRAGDAKIIAVYEEGSPEDEGAESTATAGDESPPADATASAAQDEEQAAASQAQVNAVNADVAKARAENCKKATERYNSYVTSQRLFRTGPDGQRQYLTDAELSLARVSAKKDMDLFCR
jgi:Domain of unknown function (DUF4124)